MLRQLLFFALLLLFCNTVLAQTLSGKVLSEGNEPLSANILIMEVKDIHTISESFRADDDGIFTAELEKNYPVIHIEITAMGYQKVTDSIINPQKNKNYIFYFTLSQKTTELEEVVISEAKYEIDGDTVSFNPKGYRDGTEKKVEDLIKKLPGMEVEANGAIKYRGKSVVSVQLEGDDLFGYNYTLGTRNIAVDMIEQVQAIDNYSANPLLKGIENSENVAINLKLKKGRLDISGNTNIGSGFDSSINDRNDVNSNLLGISKNFKSFGSISYNNIGLNNGAEDYFSMSTSFADVMDKEFIAKKAIQENAFSSSMDMRRANVNNQFALSYNSIYRFSQKLALKTNVSFLNDKIYLLEKNYSLFKTENIVYNDNAETIQKNKNKQLELKLTYNTGITSLLEIETKLLHENVNGMNSILQNQTDYFITNLETKNVFWKSKIQYTHKIDTNKAIQFVTDYAVNTIPQKLSSMLTPFAFTGNLQKSEFEKKYLSAKAVMLGSSKKTKYAFTLGALREVNPFSSSLLQNEIIVSSDFNNRFDYKKTSIYSEIAATYVHEKWKFQPNVRVTTVGQNYENKQDGNEISRNSLLIIPSLAISYNLNTKSIFRLSAAYEQKTPDEENLFINSVAQSNRFIRRNNLNLDLQKNQNYTLNYRFNDLFSSFATSTTLGYGNKTHTYIPEVKIENNYSTYIFSQSPTNIENYSFNFGIEKYIKFLNITAKHVSDYSINNYKNIVNDSGLRRNQSLNYNAYFYLDTSFSLPINFQNKFNYSTINFRTDNQNINTNVAVNNSLKMILKPINNWLFTFTYDYYLPNTKRNDNFTFLDFEVKYMPSQFKWIEFWAAGKNLLNNTFYTQTENSDFQTMIYQSNLIPRYFLLTIDFKF